MVVILRGWRCMGNHEAVRIPGNGSATLTFAGPLDPVEPAGFDRVREVALRVRESLEGLGMTSYAETTGSKGIHVYVPIVRGAG